MPFQFYISFFLVDIFCLDVLSVHKYSVKFSLITMPLTAFTYIYLYYCLIILKYLTHTLNLGLYVSHITFIIASFSHRIYLTLAFICRSIPLCLHNNMLSIIDLYTVTFRFFPDFKTVHINNIKNSIVIISII